MLPYFNTSKVRLEAGRRRSTPTRRSHFNTSKVRLEDYEQLGSEVGKMAFQYLKGAIGRLIKKYCCTSSS